MDWQMATAQFRVSGMTCNGCVNSVKNTLLRLPGVKDATVDLDGGFAQVEYDPAQIEPVAMITAVGQLGYTAQLEDTLREA
jgi:copper chaperone CopZ